jgi:hypothetical protein
MPFAPSTVSVIPELEERRETELRWNPSKEEEKRALRIHKRIVDLEKARQPYEDAMKRGLMLYDNVHFLNSTEIRQVKPENIVAPYARIFVDAKTAEEAKAFSDFKLVPVEDGDRWKIDLLDDVVTHIRRKTKMQPKDTQMLRQKNIMGVAIARVGYRKTFAMRKIRIEGNEDGEMDKWEEKPVPIYDDVFFDPISPLSFAIDPNATSMDDAMDCVHIHQENYEYFWEVYANDPKFKNAKDVIPGVHGVMSESGFQQGAFRTSVCQENMVVITEYFNKLRDEWVVYANGVEMYYGPLPDDHKELPFISYHNSPKFCVGFVEATARTINGEDLGIEPQIRSEETFWTQGDPETIMDLITLRTEHGRAAHRAIKRQSQVIIATQGNFQLDESRPWRDGDQAKGAMGKLEVMPLGVANAGNWQWAFDDLFQLMRLAIGVDPSNLAETRQKTATEAQIQFETAMRRLSIGLEWNEQHGKVRLGQLIHKLIQQRYTIPEIVRITGKESDSEMKRFDELERDKNGKPVYGKRYRRIKSKMKIEEEVKNGKFNIAEDDAGSGSFIARPEYIRLSDVDIAVESGRKSTQIQAIESERAIRAIELYMQLIPLTQPTQMGGKALIDIADLPRLGALVKKHMYSLGLDHEEDMGTGEQMSDIEKKMEELRSFEDQRMPLDAVPQELPTE